MSSEVHGLSDLHRRIMRELMAGWQTMDMGNETGMFRLSELSETFGIAPDTLRAELELLEAFGYVDNVHSLGMDQTEQYKGFEQLTKREHDPDDPTYFITENGKRRVVAEIASDEGAPASP